MLLLLFMVKFEIFIFCNDEYYCSSDTYDYKRFESLEDAKDAMNNSDRRPLALYELFEIPIKLVKNGTKKVEKMITTIVEEDRMEWQIDAK